MKTTLTFNDAAYGPRINSEFGGYVNAVAAARHLGSDSKNVLIGQLSPEDDVSISVCRMDGVSYPANPLKIANAVIEGIVVNMVDLRKVVRIWDEGESDKAVNKVVLPSKLNVDPSGGRISAGGENLPFEERLSVVNDALPSWYGANSPKVADLINIGEAINGNGSPFFSDCGIHSVGRPSEDNGAAVKNPSRAQTLGGFAISSIPRRAVQEKQGGTLCR